MVSCPAKLVKQKGADLKPTCRACYIAMPLYVCGFVVLGAAFQKHLSVGAIIMGWGLAEVAIMVNTVAICALFLLDGFRRVRY
jgi:hypothetical protein